MNLMLRYRLLLLLFAGLLLTSCSKETVEPQLFGDINGRVINADTDAGVANASITTQPATNAILTDKDGNFELKNVPTGNYVIQAEKTGFTAKSVNVTVREDRVSTALVPLRVDESQQKQQFLDAEVTSWVESSRNDSSFVDVEFRVRNTSDNTPIGAFEIYFGIYSPGTDFYYEVRDSSLSAGETTIGNFRKYVRQAAVDSVTVTGTWTAS